MSGLEYDEALEDANYDALYHKKDKVIRPKLAKNKGLTSSVYQ